MCNLSDYHTETYSVSIGFKLCSETTNSDYCSAEHQLKSRKSRRITSAYRNGANITIEKHFYECPVCGNRIPAYSRYFKTDDNCFVVSQSDITILTDNQLSFFEYPVKSLNFNDFITDRDTLQCPHCMTTCTVSIDERQYIISANENSLIISCKLNNITDFITMKWLPNDEISILDDSLFEAIHFDFETGKTYVEIHNNSSTLYILDLTGVEILSQDDPCLTLFQLKKSRRKIKKAFRFVYKNELPFSEEELTLDKYKVLCKFIGYDKSFYYSLPYKLCTNKEIDDSFTEIARKLHKSSDVPKLLMQTTLPNVKSVRKKIFKKPELLFYCKELELLYNIFDDVNYFCRLLNEENVFEILSILHQFSGATEYLWIYKSIKGNASLYRKLTCVESFQPLLYDGMRYFAMSNYEKERVNTKLSKGKQTCLDNYLFMENHISLPVNLSKIELFDCKINAYYFNSIKSTHDYYAVGKALNNCLTYYQAYGNLVIVVMKDNTYVAAVEISENRIIHAYQKNNIAIIPNSELDVAFCKWADKFHLILPDK